MLKTVSMSGSQNSKRRVDASLKSMHSAVNESSSWTFSFTFNAKEPKDR